jgi:hypothetical protein
VISVCASLHRPCALHEQTIDGSFAREPSFLGNKYYLYFTPIFVLNQDWFCLNSNATN